jgi:hypothetical protein
MIDSNNNNTSLFNAASNNADGVNVIDDFRRKNTHWHWGFVGVMDLELRRAGCSFKFDPEFQSKSRSYYVDMLIIVEVLPQEANVLGLILCLRRFTLCEFKSPNVSLTIRDIDRLILLCLQYYLEDDNISRSDMAAMFVVSHFPREALKNLPEGWVVEKVELGIYTIRNANILISIVVIPELNEETYKLLTSLKSELSANRLKNLIDESQQHVDDNSWVTFINVLLEINVNKIRKGEIKMSQALLEEIEKTPYGAEMLNKRVTAAKIGAIIRVLARRFGTPSAKLQKQINGVNDVDKLDELIDFAVTCVSFDEFATAFN